MMNKSKVRQTALTLLYAVLENGGSMEDIDVSLFWEIACEKETDHYRSAHAKAILHVVRATADSARLLATRVESVIGMMEGDMTTSRLREDIGRYARRTAEFEAAVHALHYSLHDKRRDGSWQLHLCCQDVLRLSQVLLGLGQDMLPTFDDFPAYRQGLSSLSSVIKRRARMFELCVILQNPLELAGNNEYVGLYRLATVLQELRPAAEGLAREVLSHREALESLITGLLQNYTFERLDVVDKCILYLALYELKYNHLEIAVVVSEATALAHDYSGSKSAPFIHGIIAAAAN